MKRFITGTLALGFLLTGSVNAMTVGAFTFDTNPGAATTSEFSSTPGATIELWSNEVVPQLALQIEPTQTSVLLTYGINGVVNWNDGGNTNLFDDTLTFTPTANSDGPAAGQVVGGTQMLPGGVFSVGVLGGSIESFGDIGNNITKFVIAGGGSFTMSNISYAGDVSPVPIPAAGIMLISALGGLLVVGRRGKKGRVEGQAVAA